MKIRVNNLINFLKSIFQIVEISNRLSHLEALRGFCTLIVCMHHYVGCANLQGDYLIFRGCGYYCIIIFFQMSSFLLTYRLMKDLEKSKNTRLTLFIVLKYAARRFVRIYGIFFIFVSAFKTFIFIGLFVNEINFAIPNSNTWFSIITLNSTGLNHLWTFAPELKFYFIIPMISLAAKNTNRKMMLSGVLFLFSMLYHNLMNFPGHCFEASESYQLSQRLSTFLLGSILGIIYYEYENSARLKNAVKLRFVKDFICIFTFCWTLLAIRYFTPYYNKNFELSYLKLSLTPAIHCFILLILILIGSPNRFSNLLSENRVLVNWGKYSFGIYLFHPFCFRLVPLGLRPNSAIELMIINLSIMFIIGRLFFIIIENQVLKLIDVLCKKMELLPYFRANDGNLCENQC